MHATENKNSITIAIVTYERMDFLPAALQSACEQEVPADDILVVDDGSGPEIRSLVEDFQSRYPNRIRYVWQENAGRPAARNRAVQECRTTHLLWLDDDDCLTPSAVASYKTILEKTPDADIIYGKLTLCNERMEAIAPMPSHEFDASNMLYLFFKHNPIPNPGTLISKACFEHVGSYDAAFPRSQDYDFYTRAASLGARFIHNPSVVCLYRSHSGNLALSTEQRKAGKYRALVVQNFIARHDLEDIFSHLPWSTQPERCLEEACWEMAYLFARCGAFDCSRDALECTLEVTPCETATFALELISQVFEGSLENFETFYGNLKLYGPRISTLINCALEFLCTPEEGDAINLELLTARCQRFSFEQVYGSLPWDSNHSGSYAAAVADVIHNATIFGGFDLVYQVYRSIGMEKDSACTFIMDILFRFQKGGLESVQALESNSLMGQPAVKNVLAALETRARRYGQQKRPQKKNTPRVNKIPIETVIEKSRGLLREAADTIAGRTLQEQQATLSPRDNVEVLLSPDVPLRNLRVSVIIPTFNRPQLLRVAAESVIDQPGGPYELIVVNDAGADIESEFLEELREADIPIHVISHKENLGLGATRNTGLAVASGEFVLFLDDDDYLVPGALHLLCGKAKDEEFDFVYGDHIRQFYCNDKKSTQEYRSAISPSVDPLVYENQIICGTFLLRRSIALACGGYREDLMVHEDYNFHLRIWGKVRAATVEAPILIYNIFDATERMNNARRAYWFATSALNHALHNTLHPHDDTLMKEQRVLQYRQIAGIPTDVYSSEEIAELIAAWWRELTRCGLDTHVLLDSMILKSEFHAPLPHVEKLMQSDCIGQIEKIVEAKADPLKQSLEKLRQGGGFDLRLK